MPGKNVITPEFRASYPNLIEPRKNDLNGKMEYSVVAVFAPGADLSALNKSIADLLTEKFGADKAKWPKPMRNPIRKNEEKEKDGKLPEGYEAGGHFITLKATQRPGLVDSNVQPIIDATQFFAGCYARAQVNPYYYEQKGNRGVSFGLNNVQKLRDGPALGNRMKAEDAFEPVAEAAGAAGGDSIFD
jgi:hypothetical protein